MPPPAPATRQLLVDAALRAFAQHGIQNASLLEITRLAGQRNRGAVHYHFGSREGLLTAALREPGAVIGARMTELLELAESDPSSGLVPVLEAIVRPMVELAEQDWRGACWLRILADLAYQQRSSMAARFQALVGGSGGPPMTEALVRRLPPMDDQLREERLILLSRFLLNSTADWPGPDGVEAPPLSTDRFVANLVAMAAAMLTAPVPN